MRGGFISTTPTHINFIKSKSCQPLISTFSSINPNYNLHPPIMVFRLTRYFKYIPPYDTLLQGHQKANGLLK